MMTSRAVFKNVYIFSLPTQLSLQSLGYKHVTEESHRFFFTHQKEREKKIEKGVTVPPFLASGPLPCNISMELAPGVSSLFLPQQVTRPQARCCLSENLIS